MTNLLHWYIYACFFINTMLLDEVVRYIALHYKQVTRITCVCLQSQIEYNTGLFKDTTYLTGASDNRDMVECRGTA